MKEYRVSVKVRNNLLLRAIEGAGFASVPKFCAAHGLTYTRINDLISMKLIPLDRHGEWRAEVVELCRVLGKMPSDLFTPEQVAGFEKNDASFEMDLNEVAGVISAAPGPGALLFEKERIACVDRALDALHTRAAEVLRMRFGIDGEELTLEQVAGALGVTRERVRQIEAVALRKLRHPGISKTLKPLRGAFDHA